MARGAGGRAGAAASPAASVAAAAEAEAEAGSAPAERAVCDPAACGRVGRSDGPPRGLRDRRGGGDDGVGETSSGKRSWPRCAKSVRGRFLIG